MNQEALENLVRIHKLHHEATDSNEVQGLIRSGHVRLQDAGLEALSLESRFDLSYNAAHALSLAALRHSGFVDGVLLMELVADDQGNAAPRLDEVVLTAEQARDYYARIIAEVVRMLGAGLIHGDLSEFNVLVDGQGPVIIDLPQAVNAAGNNSAERMLERDVDNMRRYFGKFAPELLMTDYGKEIWALYESGDLHPESRLTGCFEHDTQSADVDELMAVIDAAKEEESERQERLRDDDDDNQL